MMDKQLERDLNRANKEFNRALNDVSGGKRPIKVSLQEFFENMFSCCKDNAMRVAGSEKKNELRVPGFGDEKKTNAKTFGGGR